MSCGEEFLMNTYVGLFMLIYINIPKSPSLLPLIAESGDGPICFVFHQSRQSHAFDLQNSRWLHPGSLRSGPWCPFPDGSRDSLYQRTISEGILSSPCLLSQSLSLGPSCSRWTNPNRVVIGVHDQILQSVDNDST